MGIKARAAVAGIVTLAASALFAGDITGTWTSEFDTQIGPQKYVFTFAETDGKLGATAVAKVGEQPARDVEFKDVKLEGDALSFYETLSFQGMDIRIDYAGTLEGDEMKLTRKVGDFATEKIVVKRAPAEEAKP